VRVSSHPSGWRAVLFRPRVELEPVAGLYSGRLSFCPLRPAARMELVAFGVNHQTAPHP